MPPPTHTPTLRTAPKIRRIGPKNSFCTAAGNADNPSAEAQQGARSDTQAEVNRAQAFSSTNPSRQSVPPPEQYGLNIGLTRAQLHAKFELKPRKAEAEFCKLEAGRTAVETRTVRDNEESRARITAIQTGAATTAAAPRSRSDEEDSIGAALRAAVLVASQLPGLPMAEIARILNNKLQPENLYKLRHLKGREDRDRDE